MTKLLLIFATVFSLSASAASGASPVILDVRTPAEFSQGHVTGARNLDFNSPEFKNEMAKMDKTATYKVYCQKGGRAGKAESAMRELGFKNVENLGGVDDAAKKLHAKIQSGK